MREQASQDHFDVRSQSARVVIAGGGTGGHAIPALCVAESLRNMNAHVEFVGASDGIEATLVPQANFPLHTLPLAGFAGGVKDRVRAGVLFTRAITRCRDLLKKIRPTAILGVGGYASAPVVAAANLLRLPTFLHEQNSVPGRVNRIAGRFTREVFVTFPRAAGAFDRSRLIGMPTRREFFDVSRESALSELGLEPPVVFVFGGSGGALKINTSAVEAFGASETPYSVVQVAGRRDYRKLSTRNPRHEILEYVDDIWKYIAASDVIVSRAGAGSLFDIAAVGRAAILVPFPYATGDHQLHNARYFTEHDAAELMLDDEVSDSTIRDRVEGLLADDERRNRLAGAVHALATPEAADEVAERLIHAGEERN